MAPAHGQALQRGDLGGVGESAASFSSCRLGWSLEFSESRYLAARRSPATPFRQVIFANVLNSKKSMRSLQ